MANSITKSGSSMTGGTVRSDGRLIIIIISMVRSVTKNGSLAGDIIRTGSMAGCIVKYADIAGYDTDANNTTKCTCMLNNTRSLRTNASSRINE